jgi:hypothetical protein
MTMTTMTMTVNPISDQGSIEGLNEDTSSVGPTSVTGNVDPCGAFLPAPSVVIGGTGDVGAEIALLSLRTGQDEQRINTTAENVENSIQDAAEENEVSEMRTEASDIMSNAYAAGAMQIGQGTMQIAGGCAPSSTQADFTGAATLCAAGVTIFNAQGQAQTQVDQSIVTSDKALADRAGQMSTEASQGQADARSVISNALQFYREYQATAAQIDLVAAGQRA